MADDLEAKLWLAAWGAAAGGVMSLLVNLFLQLFLPWLQRSKATRALKIETDPPSGPHARLRVSNGGYWTVKGALVYMALDFSPNDVILPPQGRGAFITPDCFVRMEDEQLPWSVRSPVPNPIKVDVFAKERQPICPCIIEANQIVIPSEELGREGGKARVFLRRQQYCGRLKLVSADTDARYFSLTIKPDDALQPLHVSRMSRRGIRERL
jgi:hypothetical protein